MLRLIAAAGFVGAGANHFINPVFYRRIVPPVFPAPGLLVQISGVCEIAGGLGLLVRPLRRAAGWGLIALLLAVFPANIYMAAFPERFSDVRVPTWMPWLRLPLQAVFIVWVWLAAAPATPMAISAAPCHPMKGASAEDRAGAE